MFLWSLHWQYMKKHVRCILQEAVVVFCPYDVKFTFSGHNNRVCCMYVAFCRRSRLCFCAHNIVVCCVLQEIKILFCLHDVVKFTLTVRDRHCILHEAVIIFCAHHVVAGLHWQYVTHMFIAVYRSCDCVLCTWWCKICTKDTWQCMLHSKQIVIVFCPCDDVVKFTLTSHGKHRCCILQEVIIVFCAHGVPVKFSLRVTDKDVGCVLQTDMIVFCPDAG